MLFVQEDLRRKRRLFIFNLIVGIVCALLGGPVCTKLILGSSLLISVFGAVALLMLAMISFFFLRSAWFVRENLKVMKNRVGFKQNKKE